MDNVIKLAETLVYPVKSCGGASLDRIEVNSEGVVHDRLWRVTFGDRPDTLTQRDCGKMALVRTSLRGNSVMLSFADDADTITLESERPAELATIKLSETCDGFDEGDVVANWLSSKFGTPCRLTRVSRKRPFAAVADDQRFGEQLFLGQPLLIISEASLVDLNSRLPEAVRMNRFRPNLVVTGCAPYAENEWKRIRIGDVDLVAVEGCGRCSLILIDQETGLRTGKEPLRELARYRRFGKEVVFGHYFKPEKPGILRANTIVDVIE